MTKKGFLVSILTLILACVFALCACTDDFTLLTSSVTAEEGEPNPSETVREGAEAASDVLAGQETPSAPSPDDEPSTPSQNPVDTPTEPSDNTPTNPSDNTPTDSSDETFANVSGHLEVAYLTESFVAAGEHIALSAVAYIEDDVDTAVTWTSLDPTVAVVDQSGVVTGVAEGYAAIRATASNHPQVYFDFGVTVYDEGTDPVVKAIISAHNSTIDHMRLGVGSGTPVYYADLIESVNKLLFNHTYTVNTDYESVQAEVSDNHGGALDGVEFITVHYTGNMNASAGAVFHAGYFANGTGGTGIHYVVGDDGDGIYHVLDDGLIAYHAGDGAGTASRLVWLPTGVPYREGDPVYPAWGISANSRYTLNGVETSIAVPTGTTDATKCVTDARWINKMGFAYKVVDGEYYMAKTWWCYTQVAEGRLCTKGGNRTSIGIETCVNRGSDLWYTWHLTAQLVARLMQTYDLPIERVVGHHFYTAKDCPQPFLAADLDLWWEFIDCVRAEYDLLTLGEGYTVAMTVLDGDYVTDTGRVTALPEEPQLIRYQVTVTSPDGTQNAVTLASLAHPMG